MRFCFVIPTYKQVELNEICLKSLREFHPEDEVIVISDGDPQEITDQLKIICDKYNAKLLCSFWNNYFAHSVNRGIEQSNSDIIILCNNDIIFTQNITEETSKIFASDDKISVVGYLLYYPDHRIQHGGMKRFSHTLLLGHHDHGKQINEATKSLQSRYSIGCTGALLSIKKEMTNKIGILKQIGLANEDTEFCLRTWHCGYRVYYTANVSAIHAEGYTRGRTPTTKKQLGFLEAEIKSSEQFKKDIKSFDLDAIDKEIALLNNEEYVPIKIKQQQKNIGIIRSKALGDCICITGIIHKIKKDNPDCNIFVCTENGWVFDQNPNIKGIISDKKYINNHAEEIFDLNLVQEKSPQKPFWKAYADFVFGEENYNEDDIKPRLYPVFADRLSMLAVLKKEHANIGSNFAVIHVGGNNWKEKLLDNEKWNKVAEYLIQQDYKIVVVGKKEDKSIELENKNVFNMIGKFSLGEIQQLIIASKLFIGIDSGILHIAQCTNTKIIGIFTVADPKNIIHRKHWTKIIEPESECKYCLTYKIQPPVTFMKCKSGNIDCSKSIKDESIIKAIKELL